jgi:hypothetical protein
VSAIEVASSEDVHRYARGALKAADALDVIPVPLEDVEAAIGLLPAEALYAAGAELHPRFARLVAKMKSRVLGAFSFGQQTIYLDPDLPLYRKRFTHGHELGHHALPWQEQAYFIDDATTLAPETRELMEREASAFAADLLFGLDRFTNMADAQRISVAAPLGLNELFQTSAHASMRHYVSQSNRPLGLLVLGKLPVVRRGQRCLPVFEGQSVESRTFFERYGPITSLFTDALQATSPVARAALNATYGIAPEEFDLSLPTTRGPVRFTVQRFTGRLHFLLVWHRPRLSRPKTLQVVHRG